MQLSGSALIKQFRVVCQQQLFPVLTEELGVLSDKHQAVALAFGALDLADLDQPRPSGPGRPPHDRVAMLRAFLAKAQLNLPKTQDLVERLHSDATLRRLCGWERATEVPSESTFSRVFAELAESEVLERVQAKLVSSVYGERAVGHVIRDASAIPAREKPAKKPAAATEEKRRRGRPRKGDPPKPKSRLERQPKMSLTEMVEDLPKACDRGVKIGTDGKKQSWKGYKLHWDISDSGIPLSCLVTSASTHDSQVAIPLATKTSQRVRAYYELMDAGYHSTEIRSFCEGLGHVVLIPDVERNGKAPLPMEPASKKRYGLRGAIEQLTARLKDEFGGRHIRVRGWRKVLTHLMLGVLMLSVDQMLRLVP